MASRNRSTQQSRSRGSNWSLEHDFVLLHILVEQQNLGNGYGGRYATEIWDQIEHLFFERSGQNIKKYNLQQRLKNLRKTFRLYYGLSSKSGWGWDYNLNIPSPHDKNLWDEVIAANSKVAKCRDKPFPQYRELEFIYARNIAIGRNVESSTRDENEEGSGSSDDCDNEVNVDLDGINLNTQYNAFQPDEAAYVPEVDSTPSSSSKRRRSISRTPSRTAASSFSEDSINRMCDVGDRKCDLMQEVLRRDHAVRPSLFSMDDCIAKLLSIEKTDDQYDAILDAIKDERDRVIFMTLNGENLNKWMNHQVRKLHLSRPQQQPAFAQPVFFPHQFYNQGMAGNSFNSPQPFPYRPQAHFPSPRPDESNSQQYTNSMNYFQGYHNYGHNNED